MRQVRRSSLLRLAELAALKVEACNEGDEFETNMLDVVMTRYRIVKIDACYVEIARVGWHPGRTKVYNGGSDGW